MMDNYARAKLIVKTTLLHARETEAIVPDAPAIELELADQALPHPAASEGQSLGRSSTANSPLSRRAAGGGARCPTDESKS